MDVLHIYEQEAWHSPAFIIGDRAALIRLSAAIDRATGIGRSVCDEVSVSDGEGFEVHVACLQSAEIDKLRLPYSWDVARESGGAKSPEEVFMEPRGDE